MALANPILDKLREALKSEERHARDEHARVAGLSVADRVALGATWAGVRLEEAPSMRKRETRVLVRGDLHDGISPGETVRVGSHTGRCVGWDVGTAELVFDRVPFDELATAQVIDVGLDASTWLQYRKALEAADELDSRLKDALLTGHQEHRFGDQPVDLDAVGADALAVSWPELNNAQARAAQAALDAPSLAVIHGPPGTGKTRTLVALLKKLTGVRWALAESNAAVDNLALSASAAGLEVVRVGPPHRMSGAVQELSLDRRIESGPHAKALELIDRDIARAQSDGGPALWQLFDQRKELRAVARDFVLSGADVIATTFGTLVHRGDALPPATVAVVDEVTQAIEPAIWVAVRHVEKMILAGDPHQLGPVVLEPGNMLAQGVLGRLADLDIAMPMLTEQHRMHTDIMSLVSGVYGPTYHAHGSVAGPLLKDLDGVEETPLTSHAAVFVDTTGMAEDERDPLSSSVFNPVEVACVGIALRSLLAAGVQPAQIGVIAPYSAQVARLAALPEATGVEVATVNAFQGREADCILVSFTRANPERELGFVADRRRLTVALTRARRLLWLCGDSATLQRNADFAALMDTLDLLDHALVQSIWEPPWSAALD